MENGEGISMKRPPLEKSFQRKIVNKLKTIPGLYYFVKEAKALVGIPDIIICYKGRFIAWEVKRAKSEIYLQNGEFKKEGRHQRQYYEIKKIIEAEGYGTFIYPENEKECFNDLLSIAD